MAEPARISEVEVRRKLPPSWERPALREVDRVERLSSVGASGERAAVAAGGDGELPGWAVGASVLANSVWMGAACWRRLRRLG